MYFCCDDDFLFERKEQLSEEENEESLIIMDFSTNFMCCATSEIHAKQTSTKKKVFLSDKR